MEKKAGQENADIQTAGSKDKASIEADKNPFESLTPQPDPPEAEPDGSTPINNITALDPGTIPIPSQGNTSSPSYADIIKSKKKNT